MAISLAWAAAWSLESISPKALTSTLPPCLAGSIPNCASKAFPCASMVAKFWSVLERLFEAAPTSEKPMDRAAGGRMSLRLVFMRLFIRSS